MIKEGKDVGKLRRVKMEITKEMIDSKWLRDNFGKYVFCCGGSPDKLFLKLLDLFFENDVDVEWLDTNNDIVSIGSITLTFKNNKKDITQDFKKNIRTFYNILMCIYEEDIKEFYPEFMSRRINIGEMYDIIGEVTAYSIGARATVGRNGLYLEQE